MASFLPLADPQFWLVSVAALGALVWMGRRAWKRRRSGKSAQCANCAQSPPALPGGSGPLVRLGPRR